MFRLGTLAVVVVALSACGGGGSGEEPKATTAGATSLAAYIGSWSTCDAGDLDHLEVTEAQGGGVNLQLSTEYFDNDNCTGPVLATETNTWKMTVLGTGQTTAQTTLPPSTAAVSVVLDQISGTTSTGSTLVTGVNVTYDSLKGWCFPRSNKANFCTYSEPLTSEKTVQGALYSDGKRLITYEKTSTGFAAETVYIRSAK